MMTAVRSFDGFHVRTIAGWLVGRHARAAVPWVGLLLIYTLSSLTIDLPGRAPTQRDRVFGQLSREHTFGQTFVVAREELVAVRVLLLAGPGDRDDPVTLRLRYAQGNLPDLAIVVLPLHALAPRDWTTFEIMPLTFSQTATLRLDLAAPTLASPDWITVMAGPDTYPDGVLFADGVPRSTVDLAFQPVYRRRWLDWLLPISRMALGKPGLLGWPPLYALIAYCFCVALVYALARLWRTARRNVETR